MTRAEGDTQCGARLRRMAADGTLKPFSRRADPAALGYGLVAFMSLAVSQAEPESVHEGLLAVPEVIEVHYTTGDADLLARVVARDTADLHGTTCRTSAPAMSPAKVHRLADG